MQRPLTAPLTNFRTLRRSGQYAPVELPSSETNRGSAWNEEIEFSKAAAQSLPRRAGGPINASILSTRPAHHPDISNRVNAGQIF